VQGQSAELAALLEDLHKPPLTHIGALELDAFLPMNERRALAAALNTLLASPTFASWRHDLDFSALLAMTRGSGPSVLQLRLEDLLPDAVGDIVLLVLFSHGVALAEGAIVTVTDSGTRVRVLPLRPDLG
jgi:hypothetical protein